MDQEQIPKLFELTEKQILEFYRFPEDYGLKVTHKSKQLSVDRTQGTVHLILECTCSFDGVSGEEGF